MARRALIILIFLVSGPGAAAAQNTLGVVHRRTSAEAGIDAYFQGGRNARLLFASHANVVMADSGWTLYLRPSATVVRTGGRLTDLEPQLQTFVYRHRTRRFYAFAVSILDHSRIRRVDTRMRTGAGVGVRISETRTLQIRAAVGPLHEWTRFDTELTRHRTRAILYFTASASAEHLRGTAELIWAQHPTDPGDWQARVRTSLVIPVTKRFSMRVFLEHTQEQFVVMDTERGEFRMTVGALLALGRS